MTRGLTHTVGWVILGLPSLVLLIGCGLPRPKTSIGFVSSDSTLVATWAWATTQARAYAHDGAGDPVGPWYEAALPNREAFCARDYSHQALGAHLLSLDVQNRNMMSRFARYISDSKDWATYWEIDRQDRGAPVDYRNDEEFWYNLPANFDLTVTAWRLYRWTGDPWYATNDTLDHFLRRSTRDYVARWALDPDSLGSRRRFMNRETFDLEDASQASRGIPTYHEGNPGLTRLGVDLPALQAAAYRAYAGLLRARSAAADSTDPGALSLADSLVSAALRLEIALDSIFWIAGENRYGELLLTDGSVVRDGSMEAYVPWSGSALSPAQSRSAAASLLASPPGNVEMRSYLPEILFAHGFTEEAVHEMVALGDSATERREYPEVSFALVGVIVSGLMGIAPVETSPYRFDAVTTRSRLPAGVSFAEVAAVPIGGRRVDVRHEERTASVLTNHGSTPVTWIARFDGLHTSLLVDGRPTPAAADAQAVDGAYSAVRVTVPAGAVVRVTIR